MAQIDIALKNVTKEFPSRGGGKPVRAVDNVSLEIYDGEFFALLGPSGCGKTTTLRMIAGFEDTTSGEILLRGQPVQDVPPFHRPVNTVFQDYALFPHMTALQNVMFGLEMAGVRKREAQQLAMEALELVQLPDAAGRKPSQLSGGQQQRVALARAIVKKPAVLLLDEPLGALDLKLRKAMQFELKSMQQQLGITFIYVTHDQEEALTMADRIAVMDHGKVLQVGDPEAIYETPTTRFVADFIGETNFLPGRLVDKNGDVGVVKLDEHTTIEAMLSESDLALDSDVTVAIRPERISLFATTGKVRRGDAFMMETGEFRAAIEDQHNMTLLAGIVQQAVYIGTDMRYVVSIADNTQIVVRMQNYGQKYDRVFGNEETVHVFWDTSNALILSH
ncbi:MAG: spermidine/putrescine ABC transporter ATP-binding protein [Phototrophicales bacterium]|nr:MAG: spermidine/putrescine ABC transporter ATP-binding protein [Phototrophicales bacterium]